MKKTICCILALGMFSLSCTAASGAEPELPGVRLPAMADKAKAVAPADCNLHQARIDGFDRTWKVYVPKGRNAGSMPLVVALHGFGGPSMDYGSAWHLTAERAGFIVLYPEAVKPQWWNIWEMGALPDRPDDVHYLDYILDDTCGKYPVDRSRIYLTGVSMGDNMATTYAFRHADRFAAIAPTDGPTLPSVLVDEKSGAFRKKPMSAVPSMRLHGELDCMAGLPSTYQEYGITNPEYQSVIPLPKKQALRHMMDQIMKDLWLEANGCRDYPVLHLDTKRNIEIYRGKDNCDYYAYTTVQEGHGGGFERSDYIWDEFFSGFQRVNGAIARATPLAAVEPDKNAVALAAGANRAYVDNRLVAMKEGRVLLRNQELFVPVSFLPAAFPGTEIISGKGDGTARINFGGNTLQLGESRPLMLLNGRVLDSPEPFMENGLLMVPIRTLAEDFYGMHYAEEFEAAYISEKPAYLTYDFAADFRVMLGVDKAPHADIAMEKATVQKILDARQNAAAN